MDLKINHIHGGFGPLNVFLSGPIRKISVEREGTRVKRFFVSEAQRAELENLTEYRRSGTPGDFPGAVFLVLFYAKKVLREFMGQYRKSQTDWIPAFAGTTNNYMELHV
jgi:hypothetical protein